MTYRVPSGPVTVMTVSTSVSWACVPRRSAGSAAVPVRTLVNRETEALPPEVLVWGCCASSRKVRPTSWELPFGRPKLLWWFRFRAKELPADEVVAEVRTCLRTRSTAPSPESDAERGLYRAISRDGAVPGAWSGQLPGIVVVRPAAVRAGSRLTSPDWISSPRRTARASAEAFAGRPQDAAVRGATWSSACISCGAALASCTGVGPVGSRRASPANGSVPRAAASAADSPSG